MKVRTQKEQEKRLPVFLKQQGNSIIECNFCSKIYVFNIFAERREYLVFYEVKTRRNRTGLHPSF